MKDLYPENYRTLMKEIEKDTKKWKNIPCSWMGGTNIVKMSLLPIAIITFNEIPIKIPLTLFTDVEETILKFVWSQKMPRIDKVLKKNQNWRHQNSRLQTVLQSSSHQDSVVLTQKQTHTSVQQNRKPRNGPSTLWSTNIQQLRKEYPMEKKTVSSINGVGKTGQPHAEE